MSLWDMLDIDVQYKIIDKRDELNDYDAAFNKLTKDYLRNYIETYLTSKCVQLPNLSKVTKKHLVGLFKTYNIPQIDHCDVVIDALGYGTMLKFRQNNLYRILCKEFILPQVPSKTLNRPTKDVIVSKSKFEVGEYTYTFEDKYDRGQPKYNVFFNIYKITKCYVFFHSWFGEKDETNDPEKCRIHQHDTSEGINFSVFHVCASDLVLST